MFYLFFFEFLGTTELLVILVAALVLFGPRRLPQLSRSLGKSLGEFKRASEEFKQTWEREVALESVEKERQIEQAMLPEDNSILAPTIGREGGSSFASAGAEAKDGEQPSTARLQPDDDVIAPPSAETTSTDEPVTQPVRKRDWL